MKTYRVKLTLAGRFITPVQADTLWGHFCWLTKWREDEAALKTFIHAFEDDPPFILSDGFPGDLLPAPAHLPALALAMGERQQFAERKKLKNIEWLTPGEFAAVQQGKPLTNYDIIRKGFKTSTTLHSSINRYTGTTGDEGSLFEIESTVLEQEHQYVSVYLRIKDDWVSKVTNLLQDLTSMGYGKKRSVGMGVFEVGEPEIFAKFENIVGANGFMALSNFVPANTDPINGNYRMHVKYGKLGGDYAFGGKPFKRPLMMIKAGSVFKTDDHPHDYYGRMIEGVSTAQKDVVQYGYAFAIPIRL